MCKICGRKIQQTDIEGDFCNLCILRANTVALNINDYADLCLNAHGGVRYCEYLKERR